MVVFIWFKIHRKGSDPSAIPLLPSYCQEGLSFVLEKKKRSLWESWKIILIIFALCQDNTHMNLKRDKNTLHLLESLSQHFPTFYESTAAAPVIIKHFYAGSALQCSVKGIFSNSVPCPPEQLASCASICIIKYYNTSSKKCDTIQT